MTHTALSPLRLFALVNCHAQQNWIYLVLWYCNSLYGKCNVQLLLLISSDGAGTGTDLEQYKLQLNGPEDKLRSKGAERVVLYCVAQNSTIVEVLCEWHIGTDGSSWPASSCNSDRIRGLLSSTEMFCLGLRVFK